MTPLGKVTCSSPLTLLSRNAVVTSMSFIVIEADPLRTANVRHIMAIGTNGGEVLLKLIPGCSQNPCTTILAL